MTDFPSSPAFSGPTPNVATGVPRFENMLLAAKEMLGAGPLQALTIATGLITPLAGVAATIKMDTEGGAAADDLTHIAQTNVGDGRFVMLQIANNGRVITVKHNAGGDGDIELNGGLDFEMNRTEQRLWLERKGTTWVEVMRSGREAEKTSSSITFATNWADGSVAMKYWKDEGGTVHFSGRVKNTAGKSANTTEANFVSGIDAGYRPAATSYFSVVGVGASVSTSPVVWIGIDSSGGMTITVIGQALPANNDVYLDGISYRAGA